MVLKSLIDRWAKEKYYVSVPLRGYGFEIVVNTYVCSICDRVSVPLRGYGFEIKRYHATSSCHIVSVPLRGYGFEIRKRNPKRKSLTAKVSVPLRGYGFEMRVAAIARGKEKKGFRPLAGIWFWNLPFIMKLNKAFMFPSPCGDMVLKWFSDEWEWRSGWVSVPLRGYGFEILELICFPNREKEFPSPCGDMVLKFIAVLEGYALLAKVSVPLRGYGFEIMGWYIIRKDRKMFPSPCGDMVLKLARLRAIRYR